MDESQVTINVRYSIPISTLIQFPQTQLYISIYYGFVYCETLNFYVPFISNINTNSNSVIIDTA